MNASQLVQEQLRGVNVSMDGLDRLLSDQGDPDCSCQMIDLVHSLADLVNQIWVSQIRVDHLETRVIPQVIQIVTISSAKIIDDNHGVVLREQEIGEMRTDKTAAASNENAHERLIAKAKEEKSRRRAVQNTNTGAGGQAVNLYRQGKRFQGDRLDRLQTSLSFTEILPYLSKLSARILLR